MIMSKTTYVFHLSRTEQNAIYDALKANGKLSGEDIMLAMAGRVCDLEDTINLREIFK